ncbi:3240_t:CDS:2 [Cetraspora pellucida]|uniref:3240_t:CDS:1 n=1 Tax=Cetraspora pellucida TaxID=1433469 RepID=A0A9N9N7X2_9GLOM|nr:3240_t:CDS:2 [Cetraspora pellucida]
MYDTAMYVVSRTESLISEETESNGFKVSSQKNNEIVPMELNRTEVRKFYRNINKGKQVVRNTKKKEYRQKGLCFKCGQKGYIAKMCLSKQTSNPRTSSSTNANAEQANLIEKEVSVCSEKKEKLLQVKGKIGKKDALILIDSGTFKDFINAQFVETHQLMINKSIEEKSMKKYRNRIEVLSLQKYDAILGKP